jgi:signal transduction histidine kinase/DNA-binding response OmpR family regulator
MNGLTIVSRSNPYFLDYIKSSVFFILALLHLVLYYFLPSRKANLYFFIFAFLNVLNYLFHAIAYQFIELTMVKMFLLIIIFIIYTSSYLFFLLATYSFFNQPRGKAFWGLTGAYILSLPLFIWIYEAGWLLGLMLFPILIFVESGRIALIACRQNIKGARIVTYSAAFFLVSYTLFFTIFFGLLPAGPYYIFGHLAWNLGILSLPISISILLASEASFTSRSLKAKLFEVQQLSERNILQEKEKKQLQELDEIKSRFFANISHEFRTPLALIKGTIEKLKNNEGASSARQLDYQAIERSSNKLLQMINQLLDLSRSESGQLKLQLRPVNVSELLKILGGAFASLFESKGINYRYVVPLQPVWVQMDGEKLEHIINNLLSNAAKFTPANGDVNFTAAVDINHENTCSLQILVQDTGAGIPSHHLPLIFNRFFQSDNSETRSYEGTGIGLALVKELVNLMKGQIRAESIEGKGSNFLVTIPFELAEAQDKDRDSLKIDIESTHENMAIEEEKAIKSTEKKLIKSPAVLVVEDNADLRHFILEFLSDQYTVLQAKNGMIGYHMAIESLPDLIISDIMMPEMDGIDLCRKLKEDERTNHIPIILLTAKADEKSRIAGLEKGADDYLLKPFSAQELLLRVNNLIRLRQKMKEKFSSIFKLLPEDLSFDSVDALFLQKVMSIVEKNMANSEFDVDAFSKEVGMSRTQLNRKLSVIVNQSPSEFIRIFRLKRAARLLQQHQGNVGEIAFMVGFSNPNYFTKCFRDFYGIAPSEYLSINPTSEEKNS